ncbi:hypothetical protein DIPPA_25811 [Diplonema papillatum]|nr:hypothetical protein DIPPA_25811 [Diplonema papillatum]
MKSKDDARRAAAAAELQSSMKAGDLGTSFRRAVVRSPPTSPPMGPSRKDTMPLGGLDSTERSLSGTGRSDFRSSRRQSTFADADGLDVTSLFSDGGESEPKRPQLSTMAHLGGMPQGERYAPFRGKGEAVDYLQAAGAGASSTGPKLDFYTRRKIQRDRRGPPPATAAEMEVERMKRTRIYDGIRTGARYAAKPPPPPESSESETPSPADVAASLAGPRQADPELRFQQQLNLFAAPIAAAIWRDCVAARSSGMSAPAADSAPPAPQIESGSGKPGRLGKSEVRVQGLCVRRLRNFLHVHRPGELPDLMRILREWHNKEEGLFRRLRGIYGPEPPVDDPLPPTWCQHVTGDGNIFYERLADGHKQWLKPVIL